MTPLPTDTETPAPTATPIPSATDTPTRDRHLDANRHLTPSLTITNTITPTPSARPLHRTQELDGLGMLALLSERATILPPELHYNPQTLTAVAFAAQTLIAAGTAFAPTAPAAQASPVIGEPQLSDAAAATVRWFDQSHYHHLRQSAPRHFERCLRQ